MTHHHVSSTTLLIPSYNMATEIIINSVSNEGQLAQVMFKPDRDSVSINLGEVTLPFIFTPSLLVPPREIYGSYTIFVIDTRCTYYMNVPRPTQTPTVTPTRTQTPTPTSTVTPTPSFDPCKVPTPTPTITQTPSLTPSNTPTPTVTPSYNPCGYYPVIVPPNPSNYKTPTPTLTPNINPCLAKTLH